MLRRDELIALGLRIGGQSPTPTPTAPVDRLLRLLKDVIAVVELPDDGTLQQSIEDCRQAVANTRDPQTIRQAIDDRVFRELTAEPAEGADPRSGRWAGQSKTECGLHAS